MAPTPVSECGSQEPALSSLTSGDSGISASNDSGNPSNDSQYYAQMTIINDCDSLTNSIAEEDEEEEEGGVRAPYSRSISLPPRDPALTTPQRKLSESDARGAGLTGLFFQRLLASEEGAGEQYRSSSSLASLASQDSARSEGAGSSLLRKYESRASLNTATEGGLRSPGINSKFGSSFTVNKHKKVS